MRKVIVTGATGFIGKYVVSQLIQSGYTVIGVSHHGNHVKRDGYIPMTIDIKNEDEITEIFNQNSPCEGMIHLAADIDMIGSANTIKTNCLGTYYLAKLAVRNQMKFFIYMSSIPVIGKPVRLPIDETHPIAPATLYHITKFAGEQIVNQICGNFMNTMVFRISSPIGIHMNQGNYLSVLLAKCSENKDIEVYGQGLRVQNYIDVRDIAEALQCGIKAEKSGLYLISGNKSISNRELAELCKEITQSNSKIIYGKREDSQETDRWEICNNKAQKELGFVPQHDICDSLRWIYGAMKEV